MNSSFNAFQLNNIPEISKTRKHIRLKKSMSLPDDTLEYWGFYLLKGATVELKVCSRYEGSRILVVKGERNLKTCGLLEHNLNKVGAEFNRDAGEVRVTFESASEIIDPAEKPQKSKDIDKNDEAKLNHGGEIMDEEYEIYKLKLFKSKHSSTTNQVVGVTEKSNGTLPVKVGQYTQKTDIHNNKTSTKHHVHNPEVEQNLRKRNGRGHQGATPSTIAVLETTPTEQQITTESTHRLRHHGKKNKTNKHPHKGIYDEQQIDSVPLILNETQLDRKRRDLVLDRKVNHGGNAFFNATDSSESVSSFENSLLTCYAGQILLARGFPPSEHCNDVKYLEDGIHMTTTHEVIADGYYYYIFYSDNDLKVNDIHAVFDIHKPTFQYSNISESKGCINSTSCSFPIKFWGPHETVIVEVNVRDGIEHEEDDITHLISTCHPRMAVYIIFPISVLLLILGCAFI